MDDHLPATGVRLHLVGREGVLFDERRQCVYHLNSTATCIWRALEQHSDTAARARATASGLGIDEDMAATYAAEAIRSWQRLGLVGDGAWAGRMAPPMREDASAGTGADRPERPMSASRRQYALLGTSFAVGYSDRRAEALVRPTLQHLEITAQRRAEAVLDVLAVAGRYELWLGDVHLASCEAEQALAPLVNAHLVEQAIKRYRHLLALHAGAVASSAGCLLLPATGGSGKTTLTAGLLHRGWDYLSNDIVLLQHGSLDAVAVPDSLCIKEGAWEVLAPLFPELRDLPVHQRFDGTRLRYLVPPAFGGRNASGGVPVRWIVFPRYRRGAATALRPLSTADGLCRLMMHCCGLPGLLEQADIRRLIPWLSGIPCFEMELSDLDTAVLQIGSLAAGR